MERLTTDNPQNNFQTLMNYAYAKDKRVRLRFGEKNETDLCEYMEIICEKEGCILTEEDVMNGDTMMCACPYSVLNSVAVQAAELRSRLKAIEDILGPAYDMDKLKELEEAGREGRRVVLPCKVRDIIYLIDGDCIRELTVEEITCGISGAWKVHAHTDKRCILWKLYEIRLEAFGKTVFITREEAEKNLEELLCQQ